MRPQNIKAKGKDAFSQAQMDRHPKSVTNIKAKGKDAFSQTKMNADKKFVTNIKAKSKDAFSHTKMDCNTCGDSCNHVLKLFPENPSPSIAQW